MSLRGQMDSETSWLAGGQTLGPMMNLRLARPSQLVDIHKIDKLLASRKTETSVVFGAGITHAAIEDGLHPDPTGGAMRRVAGGNRLSSGQKSWHAGWFSGACRSSSRLAPISLA